ncbi:TadE/TadG family type IV pilus assembly protein [Oceanimonas marisflavi]|uniref:TadE/TadG family type IV pilus assembly protein n=1 Tax=Oceanimonas marisflavi TaxID=2059724 RepID=UPI000D30A4A0|nr:TadE family protein [Oceanimonas marisflavi]
MKSFTSKHEEGTTTVEFAIVGSVVFLVLFSLIEVGRIIYTWNALNEVARLSARLATVCSVDDVNNGVVSDMVVNQWQGNAINLQQSNLQFSYLNEDGSAAVPEVSASLVESRIVNYQYNMILPLPVNLSQWAPAFSTTLRAESLGVTINGKVKCNPDGGASL